MIQTFSTGEAFPLAYGIGAINIPFIVDPNIIASDGSTGAFRPLNTSDLGVVVGPAGTNAATQLNTAAAYADTNRIQNYNQFAQPTVDYILDLNVVITGADGVSTVTGGFRPKTTTDFSVKTIKNRKVVVSGANYTGLGTDYLIAWSNPIIARVTGILPAASTTALNQVYIIKDEGATAGAVNMIVVSGTNSLIDGVGTGAINSARGVLRLYSDGTGYNSW